LQQRTSETVTLDDVAEAAGVSPATVSRVLNRPDGVRESLRLRVRAAVAQLGYLPHGAARALASRRSNTVGAIIPTLDNAIFAKGIEALRRRLNTAGFVLLLASTEYVRERELAELDALLERGVDGIVLVGRDHDPAVYERLMAKRVPYVNTWAHDPNGVHPCVGFDNHRAAARVTRHLLDLGHREFAMIAGIVHHNDRAAQRVAGVRTALASRGLALASGRLIECRYDIGEGRAAMRALMRASTPPTAIVCGNDVLAIGAVLECVASEIPIPGRVSITGFDDLDLASHLVPPLTTMRVPCGAMGRMAAEYLINRINGHPTAPALELEPELILRNTTAPPTAEG
jgi:LacI family transcriptional regulator